ncbi:SGNH/GDSL hydrolase family protein [Cellulosimicrobium composti]|uniref:SGNH/GDSL hydrolase family protein n=1 Tax=Cellulosimicrobium composti TaxID=2672572 RepID=UPI00379517E0
MTEHAWTSVPLTDEYVRGAARLERTARGVAPHRLPERAVSQAADPQLSMVEAQPSGVRVALRTEATAVQVVGFRSRVTYTGVPPRPDGVVDLVVDGGAVAHATTSGGSTTVVDMATGSTTSDEGEDFILTFDGLAPGRKDVELWLPHNEIVEVVDVRADAPVAPVPDARPRWVHHGSSISHGSNATRPTGVWPVVAARRAGVDLTNLGLGGSALLDPFLARTIRDTSADVISVKTGINLVNADLMRMRAFRAALHGFLDTIRDGHPTTPLLVVSPIFCAIHETTPGPGAFDLEALAEGRVAFRATGDPADVAGGRLTLTTVRAEIARIVEERRADDPNLHHLDGLVLYGEEDAALRPLTDALHPDAQTHRIMGERFADGIFVRGPFAGVARGRTTPPAARG